MPRSSFPSMSIRWGSRTCGVGPDVRRLSVAEVLERHPVLGLDDAEDVGVEVADDPSRVSDCRGRDRVRWSGPPSPPSCPAQLATTSTTPPGGRLTSRPRIWRRTAIGAVSERSRPRRPRSRRCAPCPARSTWASPGARSARSAPLAPAFLEPTCPGSCRGRAKKFSTLNETMRTRCLPQRNAVMGKAHHDQSAGNSTHGHTSKKRISPRSRRCRSRRSGSRARSLGSRRSSPRDTSEVDDREPPSWSVQLAIVRLPTSGP